MCDSVYDSFFTQSEDTICMDIRKTVGLACKKNANFFFNDAFRIFVYLVIKYNLK